MFTWCFTLKCHAPTTTINCSLRLKRWTGGETKFFFCLFKTKKNHHTIQARHQKKYSLATTSSPRPQDLQYLASPGTSCSSQRWLECHLFGQAFVLLFACAISTKENTEKQLHLNQKNWNCKPRHHLITLQQQKIVSKVCSVHMLQSSSLPIWMNPKFQNDNYFATFMSHVVDPNIITKAIEGLNKHNGK